LRYARKSRNAHFLPNSAKPHFEKITPVKLGKIRWNILHHPAYSPNLTPHDYALFRKLAQDFKEKHFDEREEVKEALTTFFLSLPKEFFAEAIHDLPRRWETVIDNDGRYILK
jgi:hypothetical protein